MPQRFLKPGIVSSKKWDGLPWIAQSFYIRVVTLVDDFGRYLADPVLLKNQCFPLREDIRASQVLELCRDLASAQLAIFYKADGKEFLQLTNWTERKRSDASHYPPHTSPKAEILFQDAPQRTAANRSEPQPPKSESSSKPESLPPPQPKSKPGDSSGCVSSYEVQAQTPKGTNSPTLPQALKYFAAAGSDYSEKEVRDAWLKFEAGKDERGEWYWGKRLCGDWRAAMETRMSEQRIRAGNGEERPLSARDMKDCIAAKESLANELKVRWSSEVAMGTHWSDQEKRKEWVALRREIKALQIRLSKIA